MRFLQAFGATIVLVAIIGAASFASPPPPHHLTSAYFRTGGLRADEDADANLDVWYSQALAQMRDAHGRTQPAMWQQGSQPAEESYRELISRDSEYLMALRVYKTAEGKFYQLDELDFRSAGSGPRSHHGTLRDAEWDRLTRAVDQAHFLNAPPTSPHRIKDCPNYVLEGRKGEREYSLVSLGCRDDVAARRYQTLIGFFDEMANQAGWYPY